ncbi:MULTISPECIES: flagellar motor switch protein FliM [Chromobacterium]|uniref:Flagellar motor switch protein FliM n=2 Tax=Chromobacterium TaxID=535 RepID=A0ABS3GRA0_9NEIS|nr:MULTISPECIES: flagellar motor switch protein FliM [Chromobacterium]AXT47073.1 flagellar motor switch protein FliM [Chromobacterium rhizoryzae]MBK0415711.1 flagellar motor switch protein FliM [Chromobacterium haemolyticum]MBO0417125.1 flagellar motor switch protein FliM [Chromobacterium haemolyticum]MBO0500164.1 flagellar motor switch protein FliM [Chromobacterium haemolyticum]MDH0342706.1 flagellar motor switch protein FliM [Chromobacterium haemolyticum]
MGDDILSQEEVDALLRGVSGEDEDDGGGGDAQGVRGYDIGRQERIVRGRMPTLEIINERFARNLRIGLFNFIRRNAEISVGPVRVQKYSEFIRNLVVPTNLNLVHVKPLRGTGLLIFDPDLVFLIVDNLFGSDGRYHVRVEGRDFTPTEQRIIRRLLDVVFVECQKAWEPVHPIEFVYLRSEMNTQFANIATPTEVVVAMTFHIELGAGGGDFHICLPYSMVEPIRDVLSSTMQADRTEVDNRWVNLMTHQVQAAEVELVATLGKTKVTLGQILNLKNGDVVMLEIPERVEADVSGIPVFEASYGTVQGRYALKVEQVLAGANDFHEPLGDKEQ